MRLIFLSLIIFISFSEKAFSEVQYAEIRWSNSFESNGPSCQLYRKRLANYYQRLDEVGTAAKILEGEMSIDEVSAMIAIWKRSHMPLYIDASATYKVYFMIENKDKKYFREDNKVEVNSQLINWTSERFIFPETVMRVEPDENVIEINITLNYAQACLSAFPLNLELKNQDGSRLRLDFFLDKYSWDAKK